MAQSHAGNNCEGVGNGFVICPRLQNWLRRRCLYGLLQNDWKMKLCLKKKDHLDDLISFIFKYVFSVAAPRPKNNQFHCFSLAFSSVSWTKVHMTSHGWTWWTWVNSEHICQILFYIFLSLALFFVWWLGIDCSCSSELAYISRDLSLVSLHKYIKEEYCSLNNIGILIYIEFAWTRIQIKLSKIKMCFRMRGLILKCFESHQFHNKWSHFHVYLCIICTHFTAAYSSFTKAVHVSCTAIRTTVEYLM